MDDDSSTTLIDARLAHDEAVEAERQARQVERVIKRRSRKAWRDVWFQELERFREAMPLISDRLGLVWYGDRAQVVLYASPPAEPLKAFSTENAFTENHFVSRQEGVLAWSMRNGVDRYWVRSAKMLKDEPLFAICRLNWPEWGRDVTPTDPVDPVWARDAARMLQNGWTATRNPAHGFLGISQRAWTVLGLLAALGLCAVGPLSQMLHL